MDNNGQLQSSMDEVLTLSETAEYLKVSEKTILRMVQKGEIPCAKIASQWRFVKNLLDDWLLSRMTVVPQNDLARLIEQESDLVPLSRLIREDLIYFPVIPGTKSEVLRQFVEPLSEKGLIPDGELFLHKLLQRESMASTAVGNGVAIPHLRRPQESKAGGPLVIPGLCPEGTDFDAPDDVPVRLLFLVLSDSEVVHLRLMAKLSILLREEKIVSRLAEADGAADFMQIILKAEILLARKGEGGKK